MDKSGVNNLAGKLVMLSLTMFGFGYALVPLYNVFCDLTGLNGKTGVVSSEVAEKMEVDMTRVVTVAFDTNIREIPWEFEALEKKVSVRPGEMGEATFVVTNKSDRKVIGRAIPSVAPTQASVFFSKTECFCFDEQLMEPGERREMKVRFVVDVDLPQRYSALTLSYTFFAIPNQGKVAVEDKELFRSRI
ncbi:MAG: cytochrome c oxidase assembly protein [Gammaproteobacteria bacterium]|nr:cytochrome c oxidase assembly protein [Gammaproteobacteria bacterium]